MKKLILAAVLFASPAFAGKMKEIWWMTNESVLQTLGFDEETVNVQGHKFVTVEGADLAIATEVRGYYARVTFKCLTTFKAANGFYEVIKTECAK
ncbi:hypothetical protein ACES2L_03015 [Bdellovibrio bacteriovorus]